MRYTLNGTKNLTLKNVLGLSHANDRDAIIAWASDAKPGSKGLVWSMKRECRIEAQAERTWSKVDGVRTSSDGYTLVKMRAIECRRLAPGWATTQPQWVVIDPNGKHIIDHPALICGETQAKAQGRLAEYDRRQDRDVFRAASRRLEEQAQAALEASVKEHAHTVLWSISDGIEAVEAVELRPVAVEMCRRGLLVKVRKSDDGIQLYALTNKGMEARNGA